MILQLIKQAYGDYVLSCKKTFEWHKMFTEGWKLVEDDHRVEHPTTTRADAQVAEMNNFSRPLIKDCI